jgi:hypothetical protein
MKFRFSASAGVERGSAAHLIRIGTTRVRRVPYPASYFAVRNFSNSFFFFFDCLPLLRTYVVPQRSFLRLALCCMPRLHESRVLKGDSKKLVQMRGSKIKRMCIFIQQKLLVDLKWNEQ